jgi:cell division protein FtsB
VSYLTAEIARQQRKIKKLKDLNAALELQINSLLTEKKFGNDRAGQIFDDSYERSGSPAELRIQLEAAQMRVMQLERNQDGEFENNAMLQEFAHRVKDLEQENEDLRCELKSICLFLKF